MPKHTNFRVHPAFDLSLLSSDYRCQLYTVPVAHVGPTPSTTNIPHKTMQHYPTDYLEALGPVLRTTDTWYDLIGYFCMLFISAGTMILAYIPFLWILDPAPLSWGAFITNYDETIFLRRSILVEGLVWVHGLASAYANHLMGILYNKDMLQMVQPGLGEFQSHRVHYLSSVQILKPSIITRALILVIQAIALPIHSLACLMYAPICHTATSFTASFATQLFTDVIKAADRGAMPHLPSLHAPPVAQWFYGLPSGASYRDTLLNIRADDGFHVLFNHVCCETGCHNPVTKMEKYLVKPGEGDAGDDIVLAKGRQ